VSFSITCMTKVLYTLGGYDSMSWS